MEYALEQFYAGPVVVSFAVSSRDWCKIEKSEQWSALCALIDSTCEWKGDIPMTTTQKKKIQPCDYKILVSLIGTLQEKSPQTALAFRQFLSSEVPTSASFLAFAAVELLQMTEWVKAFVNYLDNYDESEVTELYLDLCDMDCRAFAFDWM